MEISREFIARRIKDAAKGKFPVPENMDKATAGLFWERRQTSKAELRGFSPIYNLSTLDHDGTLSMYQIYMQCATEYEAALVLLGSLRHWALLLECKWFIPHIEQWRKDMAFRDESIGRAAILAGAAGGNTAAGAHLLRDTQKRRTPPLTEKKRGKGTGEPEVGEVISSTMEHLLDTAEKVAGGLKGGRSK